MKNTTSPAAYRKATNAGTIVTKSAVKPGRKVTLSNLSPRKFRNEQNTAWEAENTPESLRGDFHFEEGYYVS